VVEDVEVRVAGGLVYRFWQGTPEVLVIDDLFSHVTLPKGHVEHGELLEEAALREIEEETGIQGRIITPLEKVSYVFSATDGTIVHKGAYYFLVEATGGELKYQEEEILGARFLSLSAARQESYEKGYENNRNVFDKGLRMIEEQGMAASLYPALIDSTLLAPGATVTDITRLCREARAYQFASVCVNPRYVSLCAELLGGCMVKVCTVIGFPLGATLTVVKVAEAVQALDDGAEELDMVIPVGELRSGNSSAVEQDIRAIVEAAGDRAIVKVILETALLTAQEQRLGAECAERAGAHFVKTSTGFAGGATVEAVRLLRQTVGDRLGVKAAGGVRTPEAMHALLQAGATRIGTSVGATLVALPGAPTFE